MEWCTNGIPKTALGELVDVVIVVPRMEPHTIPTAILNNAPFVVGNSSPVGVGVMMYNL